MKSTRVCHLTSVHSRYDIRIFLKECRSLENAGYEVFLIVADGKGDEIRDNVSIIDVGRYKSRLERMLKITRLIYKKAEQLNADIYHFHDPELIPTGLKLKGHNKKVIYDMHEDVPKQIMLKKYIWLPLRYISAKLFSLYQKYSISKLDVTVVPQPTMVDTYSFLGKTELVENFAFSNDIEFRDFSERKYNKLVLCHAGGLTIDRGIINMLELACLLDDSDEFYLAGRINPVDAKEIKAHRGWKKVKYLGELPSEDVNELYRKSNLGVILYNNVGQYGLSYAIKLFEYMSYGLPVIMPNFGEWIKFNKINKCGINVDVKSHEELHSALNMIRSGSSDIKNMSLNGHTVFIEKYSWNFAEEKLIRFYKELVCA